MPKLVLWGHHIADCEEMFALPPKALEGSILEYGCGASAVNAECLGRHGSMVSCDPLFTLDKATLKTKASLIFEENLQALKASQEQFDFSQDGGFDAFVDSRRKGMATFFADYEKGLQEQRYVPATSLSLPYRDFTFDFAVCGHYLFADLEGQDQDIHIFTLLELARVAKEVRVFPLIDASGQLSSYLGPVLLALQQKEFGVEVREVQYHLQTKGNALLRIWAQQCVVEHS